MTRVEIGDTAIQRRLPGVENFAESSSVSVVRTEFAAAFRIRTHVDRLRQSVAEDHLQSMTGRMLESELAGIVVAHADGIEGVEGGELILPEMRLPASRTSIAAVEVNVGESRGRTILRTIRSPLIGVDSLGRAFTRIVNAS